MPGPPEFVDSYLGRLRQHLVAAGAGDAVGRHLQVGARRIGLDEISFDRSVIIGEAGLGKSTCLRRLALMEIESGRRVPVVASLADWHDRDQSVVGFLPPRSPGWWIPTTPSGPGS